MNSKQINNICGGVAIAVAVGYIGYTFVKDNFKGIFDGYNKAAQQVELQKQQMELSKKESEKKFKYVTKEKYNTITSVLNKEILCWVIGVTPADGRKAVEGLAVQLVSSYGRTDGEVIGIDMELIKKNEELLSKHINSLQPNDYSDIMTEAIGDCPIYHQQIVNILEGVESITKEDVKVILKEEIESRKSK